MLHDVSEPAPTADKAMDDEYRRIMIESGDDGMSSAKALDIAAGRVVRMVEGGDVEAPDLHMTLVGIGKRVDRAHGNRADSIIAKMAQGQFHLFEDRDLLETIVTLGDGRRKSWKFVTANDLKEMREVRQRNMKAAVESFTAFEASYNSVLKTVLEHNTVGAAAAAGAFAQAA